MKLILKCLLLLICFNAVGTAGNGQEWKKQPLDKNNDSLVAIYSWEVHVSVHSAGGEIILFKTGRYKYSGYRPFDDDQYSEGSYKLTRHTLILNSDFQPDSLKVKVDYLDSFSSKSDFVRLGKPKNSNGKIIDRSFYQINDTATKSFFEPYYPFTWPKLDSLRRIKLCFDGNDFTSGWIPISVNDKFIQITILSDKDFDVYKNKVFTNVKFRVKKKKIVATSKTLL
jgi:hypothetical protein